MGRKKPIPRKSSKSGYNTLVVQILIGVVFFMTACKGGEESYDQRASQETVDARQSLSSTQASEKLDWRYMQKNLFISCIECHNEAHAEAGLSLTGIQYENLVFLGKTARNGQLLINPGNAKESYLYIKMADDLSVKGEPMPFGRGELNNDNYIALMERWIDEGAIKGDDPVEFSGEPDWNQVQALIFEPYCVGCHSQFSKNRKGSLSLERDQYEKIISPQKLSSKGVPIIKAGDSQGSYLYQVLTKSRRTDGSPLPHKGVELSFAEKNLVARWIDRGAPAPLEATWRSIQANVFEKYCFNCHNNEFSYRDLSLAMAPDHQQPAGEGRESSEFKMPPLIDPGNKENSYLYLKLTGDTKITGVPMPGLGVTLKADIIKKIGEWIDSCAEELRTDSETTGTNCGMVKAASSETPSKPATKDRLTWNYIQENIFKPYCLPCHGKEAPILGLSWTKDQYDTIITDNKLSRSGHPIVTPGTKFESYLYLKVTGDIAAGKQMPLGGPYLSKKNIELIASWIEKGAPQSTNSSK